MIKTRINNEYKDIIKIFGGGALQKEITKVWSREAQKYVYESEVEYTGTLPITITADGNALLDYRIYGNTVQTGTPTPENPIMPSGCGVRTENLFDADIQQGSFAGATGEETTATTRIRSTSINVTSGTYTISIETDDLVVLYVYDSNGNYIRQESVIIWVTQPYTFNIIGDRKIRFAFRHTNDSRNISPGDITQFMLNLGSTALPYEPYGYKLPILSNSTVTNIYIGDTQLVKDEYVDSATGKIYREVSGTLTPTDPPVLLPEIPTFEGTTVIDYDGATKPSQMYIKYRR